MGSTGFYIFTQVADSPFWKIMKYKLLYYQSAVVEFMKITKLLIIITIINMHLSIKGILSYKNSTFSGS